MRATAFAAAAALGSVAAFEKEPASWTAFKATHGKIYGDDAEERRRFEIFNANLEFIAAENAKAQDYELASNQFTDMSADELDATSTGFSGFFAEEGLPNLSMHTWGGEELPDEIDWTEKGAVTPVKNQKHCGSCWAFSAIGALEGAAALAGHDLVALSEQQLVDCSKDGNAGCRGGLMDYAFAYAQDHALCSEESYAYLGRESEKCEAGTCDTALERGQVAGFKDVGHKAEDLMSALTRQPVAVAIEADRRSYQFYKDGVFTKVCGGTLDHGVLAVGYGVWPQGDLKYWKVKNSWGASWGKDGYILLSRDTRPWRRTGECGILKQASYPEVASAELVV